MAFENARRITRGGLVEGGAPFTKDAVYLEGLIRVHNFLRIAVQETRVDCIRLLFAGKMDIDDMPAITTLAAHGLCTFPRFLPPWARDLRFVLSYIAYSSFLNRMNLERVRGHYKDMLDSCAARPRRARLRRDPRSRRRASRSPPKRRSPPLVGKIRRLAGCGRSGLGLGSARRRRAGILNNARLWRA